MLDQFLINSPGKTPIVLSHRADGGAALHAGRNLILLDRDEVSKLVAALTPATTPARARLIAYPILADTSVAATPS